ncbi:ABC transporter permease [Lachnospiraceae bacterium 50-23]
MKKIVDFFKSTAGMVLIVTILAGIVVHIMTGNFWTAYNISTLTRAASFIIIVSFGQTLVLLTGGIDLSVAAVGSVSSMAAAKLMIEQGMNPWISILISCIVGLLLGMVNGLFIAYLRLTPFIVTLATGEIYKGIVYIVTKGTPIVGVPEEAQFLANGVLGGFLPTIVIIMLVICIILAVMLRYTKFGRHVYALGGNRNCAKIVGIKTERVEVLVYCLSGLLAAVAGVMMTCKLASFQASIGANWVNPTISASVLGGTSMTGGIGGVVGTVIGGLLNSTVSTSITLLRVSSYWETVVTGGVVLVAVTIDAVKENPVMRDKVARIFKRK